MPAERRFQFVSIVECRRGTEDLEAAENRMADDVDQGDHPKPMPISTKMIPAWVIEA